MGTIKKLEGYLKRKINYNIELNKIAKNSFWLFGDKIFKIVVGLIVGVWIARYLGPENFGTLSYAIAVTTIFNSVATVGLDGILIKELVNKPRFINSILGSAFILKLAGSIFAFILSIATITFFQNGESSIRVLVAIIAANLIFQSATVIDFYFQAHFISKNTVLASITSFTISNALKIYLVISNASLISFAWVVLIESALYSIFLFALYQTSGQNVKSWKCNYEVMINLFREAWPILLNGLAVTLYMRIDVIMLKELTGDDQVGIYSAATRISEVFYFVPTIIVSSVAPKIISNYSSNYEKYLSNLKSLYFFMTLLSLVITIPLFTFSHEIINFLYGKGYYESASVLAIHLWANLAVFLGVASSQFLIIENMHKIAFYRTLIGLISNVLLNFILIKDMGAIGAAIATLASYFIANYSILLFPISREHGIFLNKIIFQQIKGI